MTDIDIDRLTGSEKLILAARLTGAVMATLNGGRSVCPCCGVTRYADRWQFNAHAQLDAVQKKLLRLAGGSAVSGGQADDAG